jgi:hypothetical protein
LTAMGLGNRTGSGQLPGAALSRDISRGEIVEAEIDAFISKRHNRRVAEEGERAEEEMWAASERAYFARKREENRREWCGYFERLAVSLRARAEEYDQRAQTLMEDEPKGAAGERARR